MGNDQTSYASFNDYDASDRSLKVCRNLAPYSAGTVTYETRPRYDDDCQDVKATKENDWATVDLTEWMRDWVTDPKKLILVLQ